MGYGQHTTMHPDENLLAAFAEQTLAPAERGRVLEHLSHCADCRDTVFLAQQAAGEPALQTALRFPKEHRTSAALRWRWASVSAAGFVFAALIVGSLRMHRPPASQGKLPPAPMVASRQGTPSAQLPAEPKAAGDFNRKVATVRKPVFPSRPSRIAPSAQAEALTASEAATTANALISSAAPANFDALAVNAQIAGSVLDPSGAAIPGAKVSLRLDDATTRRATTDPAGHFEIHSVPPGNYTVEFIAPGFQTAARAIDVHAQERAALSEILAIGSASQTVSVSAASAETQLQTESSEVASAINGTAIKGRNVIQPTTTFSVKNGVVQSCVGTVCFARLLPSRLPAVSIAFDRKTAIVVDASGNLFSNADAGEHWAAIKPQWQGKAITLNLTSPPSAGVAQANAVANRSGGDSASGSLGGPVPVTRAAPSVFSLTNDQGQVWLSSDEGQTWHLQ